MTMQMMKTTARTGPTTHMSPSPGSTGRGSTIVSSVFTISVYGLVANIFYTEEKKSETKRDLRLSNKTYTVTDFYSHIKC